MRKGTYRPDGQKVTHLRVAKGWDQELLAAKSGVSKRTVERIEQSHPTILRSISDVAEALAVDVPRILVPDAAPKPIPGKSDDLIHLNRRKIVWDDYNEVCKSRFLACGTSLRQIHERRLVREMHKRGVPDIRLVLPATDVLAASRIQLDQYDRQDPPPATDPQAELAERAYERLKAQITALGMKESVCLRRYHGIMFANITVIDDDAFLSFYDSTGVGETNITLHFNRIHNPSGYDRAIEEFDRMWEAESHLIALPKKKQGTSIALVNAKHDVMLCLRDDKPSIPCPGLWDMLGGHVKPGEVTSKCIAREIKEEIGYRLRQPSLFNVYDLDDRIESMFWEQVDINIAKTKLTEGQRLEWFSLDRIRRMRDDEFAFGFRTLLLEFFKKRPFSRAPARSKSGS